MEEILYVLRMYMQSSHKKWQWERIILRKQESINSIECILHPRVWDHSYRVFKYEDFNSITDTSTPLNVWLFLFPRITHIWHKGKYSKQRSCHFTKSFLPSREYICNSLWHRQTHPKHKNIQTTTTLGQHQNALPSDP